SRKLFVTGIKNFLGFHLGERALERYKFDLETSEQATQRQKENEDTKPISVEEFKRLVSEARSTRDRAILLTLANGLGTGEWLQFAHEWYKYADAIRAKKSPIIV